MLRRTAPHSGRLSTTSNSLWSILTWWPMSWDTLAHGLWSTTKDSRWGFLLEAFWKKVASSSKSFDEWSHKTINDKFFSIISENYLCTLFWHILFQVNINERSYWAPFYYNMTDQVYSCDLLFNGWSRDSTVRNWACFTAIKAGVDVSL